MHCLYLLNLLSCKSFLHFWITELTEVMACVEEVQLLTTASLCALLHIKIYRSISLVAVLAQLPVSTYIVSFPEIILCFLQQRLRQFGLKNSKYNDSSSCFVVEVRVDWGTHFTPLLNNNSNTKQSERFVLGHFSPEQKCRCSSPAGPGKLPDWPLLLGLLEFVDGILGRQCQCCMLHEPRTPGPHTGKSSCSCNGIIRVGKVPFTLQGSTSAQVGRQKWFVGRFSIALLFQHWWFPSVSC